MCANPSPFAGTSTSPTLLLLVLNPTRLSSPTPEIPRASAVADGASPSLPSLRARWRRRRRRPPVWSSRDAATSRLISIASSRSRLARRFGEPTRLPSFHLPLSRYEGLTARVSEKGKFSIELNPKPTFRN
ncbi:hypothetical protein GUJ93_ZPchr0002g24275 [Zizania palustris]|uniref:Uncharacterized protein n=1 Tax=Zizania palustris TaxID=103762 RepID=A0A8J5RUR6_ZIZPA|nr:hypothetical protein GUJ93_ZPchr0002g24275 [Zizania palustris]